MNLVKFNDNIEVVTLKKYLWFLSEKKLNNYKKSKSMKIIIFFENIPEINADSIWTMTQEWFK